MNEPEAGNSNEVSLKAAERLRKKKLSRTEAETMSLIHELEARRIQLDMHKALANENALKASTDIEKLISIYDLAPTGYYILDSSCNISSINMRGAGMLGKERAVLLRSNFREFIITESIPVFDDFLQRIIDAATVAVCDLWLQKDNGDPILAHVEGVRSFRDNSYLLTAIDITERKLAEKKLEISEIRYRRLFESAQVGVMILDAANGKILDANHFLINLLGYDYEELLGRNLWELGTNINLKDTFNVFPELQNRGYVYLDDLTINTRDGKMIFVEIAGNLFSAGNEKIIEINFHDITERKIAEKKIKGNEERLQELNLTKDKFLSIIAHDLKSAFNNIIGLGNLLAEKVRKKDYEEVETFAYIIQESSWKAMDLLTNLLEWSRSQTGRIEFNPHDIEILELISDVCEFLKESAYEKSIKISVEDPQNAIAFCDKEMISTVLRNLISNAIKFTERNGFIIVSVTREESCSRISVGDNGIGMKKEIVEKLFRIEESFSTTGTAGEEGTGMGLLLCKDFIDRHKGKIWAESEPGKGTRIIFELPARTASLHSNS